jgi:hypothetical protein
MDLSEIQKLLDREIPRGVAAWRKLPELIESGRLGKGSGGWYRVKDHRVLDEVQPLIKGYRMDKASRLTHVQLSKPSKRLIDFADSAAARGKSA